MSEMELDLTHGQMVSAAISLCEVKGGDDASFFSSLGFSLDALELEIVSSKHVAYVADVHLICTDRRMSLLLECKSGTKGLKQKQTDGYLSTRGVDVVRTGAGVPDPRAHDVDVLFLILPGVTDSLLESINASPFQSDASLGIVELHETYLDCRHNGFSDEPLSARFTEPLPICLDGLYFGRLPYESDSPNYVLADKVFQALVSFLISGLKEFTLLELAHATNPLLNYMRDQFDDVVKRVGGQMRAIRKVALFDWIEAVDVGTTREEKWRFTLRRRATNTTLRAIQTRHQGYIRIMTSEGRKPTRADFEARDEQLTLPFIVDVPEPPPTSLESDEESSSSPL